MSLRAFFLFLNLDYHLSFLHIASSNWFTFCLSLDVSRCVAERKYTQEQARKEFQQVFIPECNDDGTYSQVEKFSFNILHGQKVRICMFAEDEEETNVMKGNVISKWNVIYANTDVEKWKEK